MSNLNNFIISLAEVKKECEDKSIAVTVPDETVCWELQIRSLSEAHILADTMPWPLYENIAVDTWVKRSQIVSKCTGESIRLAISGG